MDKRDLPYPTEAPQYSPPPYTNQMPQPGMAQSTAGATSVTVGGIHSAVQFGPNGQSLICPHCHQQIITSVESKISSKTHLFALLLCVFCCWPCACAVYCIDSCKNRSHTCPSCSAYLGTYEK